MRKILLLLILCSSSVYSKPTPPTSSFPSPSTEGNPILWRVKYSNKYTYCIEPYDNGYYSSLYIDHCSNNGSRWLFDIFGRISTVHKGAKLCVTTPPTVTNGNQKWDYLGLTPCEFGNPAQIMSFKKDNFYTSASPRTGMGELIFKDFKYFLYVSRNGGDSSNHRMEKESWAKVSANPRSLGIRVRLNIKSNSSTIDSDFTFDETNQHLINIHESEMRFPCLMAPNLQKDSYAWALFRECSDKSTQWDIIPVGDGEHYYIKPKDTAFFLARTLSGIGLGDPLFIADSGYYKNNAKNKHITFKFNLGMQYEQYERYKNKNYSATTTYCPSPGDTNNKSRLSEANIQNQFSVSEWFPRFLNRNLKGNINPNWQLTNEWLSRIFKTIRVRGADLIADEYGECVLQTVQLVQELFDNHLAPPQGNDGFYFPLNSPDLMASVLSNYQPLVASLRHNQTMLASARYPGMDEEEAERNTFRNALNRLLPNLTVSDFAFTEEQIHINDISTSLIHSPLGSVFILDFNSEETTESGESDRESHVFFTIRTENGLRIFDTNWSNGTTEESYRTSARELRTVNEITDQIWSIRPEFQDTFRQMVVYRVESSYEYWNSINYVTSQGNCTNPQLVGSSQFGDRNLSNSTRYNFCFSDHHPRCRYEF